MISITIHKKWIILVSIVLFTGIGFYTAYWVMGKSVFVPEGFLEARIKGAELGDAIVSLSEVSISNLKEVEKQYKNQDYKNGLETILKEIGRNEEARQAAIALSIELENMAKDVASIRPKAASDTALQAIIVESQIVQRLINYNGYIYELLNYFRSKFDKNSSFADASVPDLIDRMNREITSINELNTQYKVLMGKFDDLTN